MNSARTVLCCDGAAERRRELAQRLTAEGFAVIIADSPAECITLAAAHHPAAIVLDADLLYIDRQSLAEYLYRVSAASPILITHDGGCGPLPLPLFVQGSIARGNLSALIATLARCLTPAA